MAASLFRSGFHPIHKNLSNNLYNYASNLYQYAGLAYSTPRDYLAKQIATQFFYVLTTKGKKQELQDEQDLHTRFWKTELSTPPFKKEEITACFHPPREESFEIKLHGKTVTYTVSIVESKVTNSSAPSGSPIYNHVYIAGNHTRKDTFLTGIYPYLDSYLTQRNQQMHFSGARMVNITGYDIRDAKGDMYFPKTLDEHGQILEETLCAFQDKYGPIEQIEGHSLGGILLAAALRHVRLRGEEKYLPKHILFDRTPDSIYGASKNHYMGCVPVGRLVYPLAWMLGWDLNVADEVNQFCRRFKGHMYQHPCTVLDAILDHRFQGAHLGKNKQITQLEGEGLVKIIRAKLPGTQLNEGAQHGIQANAIYGWNIKQGNKEIEPGKREFMQDWQNLSDKVLEISLCKKVDKVVESKIRTAA